MLTLRRGGAVLHLLPEIGGAVSRFAVDGIDVLRPAPDDTRDVLQTGCFPLAPFANRIANGAFEFRGEKIRLPKNFGDHPHVLHGQGWQNPWRVRAQSPDSVVLDFDYSPGNWPWAYAARQTFTLGSNSLCVELAIGNRGDRAMPVSLGFHPYFARTQQTVIRAEVIGVWLSDDACIPTAPAGPSHFLDLLDGAPLATAPFVDHCHFGWRRGATIEQPELRRVLHLVASPALPFLHLYIPKNAGFFCVEPVSAMPNAINRNEGADVTGLRVIAPGKSISAAMILAVQSRA